MATVFIPTMLQPVTDGVKQITVEGHNVRKILDALDALYPGIRERLLEDGQIKPSISVAVDGEVSRLGVMERVGPDSEVHFVPAISGGAMMPPARA